MMAMVEGEGLKDDLPDRLGAMLVKELRQNLRRGSFVYPFLAIHLLAIIAMVIEFQVGDTSSFTKFSGMLNVSLMWTSGPFWLVVAAVCLLVMPLGGLVLMGQELEEGNHELLLLTQLNRWKVVRGKFLTLWGLCALTFVSLMPYVIVRYLVGSIELVRELGCSMTILGGSAIMCAGAIGASSFRGLLGRTGIMLLFTASMALASGFPLAGIAFRSDGCGFLYYLTAFCAVGCYVIMGLSLARSRLRLVVHAYEVKPSFMIVGLLIFTPFVCGMVTLMTGFWGGAAGLIGMALVALNGDVTPKAPAWVKAPAPNVPPPFPPVTGV